MLYNSALILQYMTIQYQVFTAWVISRDITGTPNTGLGQNSQSVFIYYIKWRYTVSEVDIQWMLPVSAFPNGD